MKNLIFKSFFVLFLFSLSACNNDEDAVVIDTPTDVQYIEICNLASIPNNNQYVDSQHVIRSLNELNNFTNSLLPLNFNFACFNSSEFDFNSNIIIMIVDKTRPHSAYNITIVEVLEYRNRIEVKFKSTENTETGHLPTLTTPAKLYKINNTEKPIQFINETP